MVKIRKLYELRDFRDETVDDLQKKHMRFVPVVF